MTAILQRESRDLMTHFAMLAATTDRRANNDDHTPAVVRQQRDQQAAEFRVDIALSAGSPRCRLELEWRIDRGLSCASISLIEL
jgi:hypothetical protein